MCHAHVINNQAKALEEFQERSVVCCIQFKRTGY